jgi:exopolysaccharide biosynthesis protein
MAFSFVCDDPSVRACVCACVCVRVRLLVFVRTWMCVRVVVCTVSWTDEMAPRTAIGIRSNGQLVLLVVDGEEDIKAGADLYMMQDILLGELDVTAAMNLDGGGSSVAVYKDEIVSHPTCSDTHVMCERAVSSTTCISVKPNL